jgi:D-alanyl-D-alanine carboxypeptidase/D-alanyl-D-alanine-endopeptidase (penicillin-binding protein 4)
MRFRRFDVGGLASMLALMLALGLGPMGPARAQDALPAAVRAALQKAGVPPEALGAVALPLGPLANESRVWRHRADVPMQPASTLKVLTSVVALDLLGTGVRGSTELRTDAPLQDGVLAGDLVLKGGADPDLGVPEFWAMLTDLQAQGVREVRGDLMLDRSLFRPVRMDIGVPPFDDTPEFYYNVIPDALQLSSSVLPLEFTGGPAGVAVRTVPVLPGLALVSRMTLNDKRCEDWDDDWKPARIMRSAGGPGGPGVTTIELNGAFPRGCTKRAGLQLIDRNELAERMFRTLWEGMGGRWTGQVREGVASPASRLLARRESRPWGDVLRNLNKNSDNIQARMLYLMLGVPAMAANPDATTAQLADRAVRNWLANKSIHDGGLVLDNGSGLSRSERITPWQLASVLKVAQSARYAPDLAMSLPVAAADGSMRNRLKASPAAGWARLKVGGLRNVSSIAGYVDDEMGRPWALVAFINHDDASKARPALDALVDHIARWGPHGVAWAPKAP